MGTFKVLILKVRVDLEIITIKVYSILPKSTEPELHHQVAHFLRNRFQDYSILTGVAILILRPIL